jgi:hypothetical protein
MILRWISSHDENDVCIGDIGPAVRHSSAAESGGQTGHRGAVSKTGLIFVSDYTEPKSELAQQVVHFIRVGAAADHGGVGDTIYGTALRILLLITRIARVLDEARHSIDGLIPRHLAPIARARCPVPWKVVHDELTQRDPFRAQRSAVDRAIGVALDVNYSRDDVSGFVTESVNDHSTGDCTVGAYAVRFGGPGNFEFSSLRQRGLNVKTECSRDSPARESGFDKRSAGNVHGLSAGKISSIAIGRKQGENSSN